MNIKPRIQENKMSEKEYRALKTKINASSVKKFIGDREGFVKELIYGEPVERKETVSTIMGSLVHTLILEKERFDEKYAIASMIPPVGQMKELCDNLYLRTVKCMTDEGEVTLQLSTLLEQAIQDTKYDAMGVEKAFKGKSLEKIVEMFAGDPELYYKELRSNHGKTVVSIYQIEKAEHIVNEMKSNEWISRWINAVDTEEQQVYNEQPILFRYKDMEMRALIDRIIVNHETKTVEVMDIKTTWDGDGVSYTYTSKLWYIQAAVYDMSIKHFVVDNGLEGYTIEPIRWLIADTTGFNRSVSYKTSVMDLERAYNGFKTRTGRKYTGTIEALEEIMWCQNTGIWNTTREVVSNKGEMTLDIPYE